MRTERHAHADFLRAAHDGECQHTVDAHRCRDQRNGGEDHQQRHIESRVHQLTINVLLHGADAAQIHVRVKLLQPRAQHRNRGCHVGRGAHNKLNSPARRLCERPVDLRLGLLFGAERLYIAHHAHDFEFVFSEQHFYVLADGILPGPIAIGHRFINDGDVGRADTIGTSEVAAAHQANAECLKVLVVGIEPIGSVALPGGQLRLADNVKFLIAIAAGKRNRGARTCCDDARHRAQFLHGAGESSAHLLAFRVLSLRAKRGNGDQVRGIEARLPVQQVREAPREQSCADEQQKCERDFHYDECVAGAIPTAALAAAAPSAQRFLQIRIARSESGQQAADHSGEHRNAQRENHHRSIHADAIDPREAGRSKRDE